MGVLIADFYQNLKSRLPCLKGKIVLQDLPAVVEKADVTGQIEAMAVDFFDGQPIKGETEIIISTSMCWKEHYVLMDQIQELRHTTCEAFYEVSISLPHA
jgi:hypothetical protein